MADVTGGPVVTNASPFAVPADLTALKDHFGDTTKYTYATVAALPASGNWVGRQAWVQEAGGKLYVCTALPGTWAPVIGTKRTTGSSGSVSTTLTSIMSLSLPAGTWEIDGGGYVEKSTAGTQTFTVQLWNATAGTEIDIAKMGIVGDTYWPMRVKDVITLAVTTTVQFRVQTSATGGTQLFSNGKLFARQAVLI